MRALLKKDFYVLSKQMRFFLLALLIFAALPTASTTLFAVVYSAMLPYSTLAYDERSKWDRLAAMLPYSTRDIVLSKYVLGYLFCALATCIAILAKILFSTAGITPMDTSPLMAISAASIALLLMALTLPPMFRFGVEKGRVVYIIVIVAVATGSLTILGESSAGTAALMELSAMVLPVAAVVINIFSILLSIRLYPKRDI